LKLSLSFSTNPLSFFVVRKTDPIKRGLKHILNIYSFELSIC